jgi:hypothetical protein
MATLRWLGTLVAITLFLPGSRAEDVVKLFNGKNLSGWVVDGPKEYKDKKGKRQSLWTVNSKDEIIVCAGKAFGFLRYDKAQFADFTLHVEYRLAAQGNSGIGIRTVVFDPKRTTATRPSRAAYEVQLLDDAKKNPSKYTSGSLYRYVAPKVNAVRPSPEWNTVDIECFGPRIRIRINDQEVLDVDQSTVEEIKDKPLKGYICLQSHSHQVEFRNIWIQEKKMLPAK